MFFSEEKPLEDASSMNKKKRLICHIMVNC